MNSATALMTSHNTEGNGPVQYSNHELCHRPDDVTQHGRQWARGKSYHGIKQDNMKSTDGDGGGDDAFSDLLG
jgi:hypothetical protein